MKMTMMICDKCGAKCKQAETINAFDSVFCLHDDKLRDFKRLHGLPMTNDSKSADVVTHGSNSAEKRFIDKNRREGNTVVRSSDGILRSVGKE